MNIDKIHTELERQWIHEWTWFRVEDIPVQIKIRHNLILIMRDKKNDLV